MAIATPCQTDGAIFVTEIKARQIVVGVGLPFDLDLSEAQAETLEANLHNALELVLAPYFL